MPTLEYINLSTVLNEYDETTADTIRQVIQTEHDNLPDDAGQTMLFGDYIAELIVNEIEDLADDEETNNTSLIQSLQLAAEAFEKYEFVCVEE